MRNKIKKQEEDTFNNEMISSNLLSESKVQRGESICNTVDF